MNNISKKVTAITFTNRDNDSMTIKVCDNDPDIIEIHINGEEFWFDKDSSESFVEDIKDFCKEVTKH